MDKKVSIIIPVYNVAPYIEECLRSVDNQTYKNIEVIIVDDCGVDNSMELVTHFIEESVRREQYVIVKHDCNKGLSASRNTGIRKAKGEYLYFLDSDDKIKENCIERMMCCVSKHFQAELVYAGNSDYDMETKCFPDFIADPVKIKCAILTRGYWPITAWNKLVSRQFILSHNLFFKEGIVHEDELWNFYLAKYLRAVCFLKENTYYYRMNTNGIMRSQLRKQCKSMDLIIRDCIKHLDSKCLCKQLDFILHITHANYVKQLKTENRFILFHYIGTIIYLFKILILRD